MYHCQVDLWALHRLGRIPCAHTSLSHTHHSLTSLPHSGALSVSHTQHTFTHTHTHTFTSILYQDAEAGWLYLDQDLLCVRPRSWAWRHATSPADPDSLYIPLQPSSPFRFLANSSVSSVCSVSACTVNTKAWHMSWPPIYCLCKACMCVCCMCVSVRWPCASSSLVSSLALLPSGLVSVKTCFSSVSLASSLALLPSGLVSDKCKWLM